LLSSQKSGNELLPSRSATLALSSDAAIRSNTPATTPRKSSTCIAMAA